MKQFLLGLTLLILVPFVQSCSSSYEITDYPRFSDSLSVNKSSAKQNLKIPNLKKFRSQVAPGYRYYLYHPSDKKLQGYFRSDFKGKLRLPYNVVVNTKKKTFNEIKEKVMNAYHKFFQKGVEGVTFKLISATRWVEVRGLVNKPGKYLVKLDTALDSVIDKAGGIKGDITKDYFQASIEQRHYKYSVVLNEFYNNSDLSDKITWLGGDTIFIKRVDMLSQDSPEVPFVTILGGVSKPGKILYKKNASLFYFIDKSGGLITGLGYDECYLFRQESGQLKKINFNFSKPETIPVIYPGDTIYMNSQVVKKGDLWLRRLAEIATLILFAIKL
jgi:protein involved in polysaccharide export with SLBB domain